MMLKMRKSTLKILVIVFAVLLMAELASAGSFTLNSTNGGILADARWKEGDSGKNYGATKESRVRANSGDDSLMPIKVNLSVANIPDNATDILFLLNIIEAGSSEVMTFTVWNATNTTWLEGDGGSDGDTCESGETCYDNAFCTVLTDGTIDEASPGTCDTKITTGTTSAVEGTLIEINLSTSIDKTSGVVTYLLESEQGDDAEAIFNTIDATSVSNRITGSLTWTELSGLDLSDPSVSPATAKTNEDANWSTTYTGDNNVNITFNISVDGTLTVQQNFSDIASGTKVSLVISSSNFTKGQVVSANISASDGTNSSTVHGSFTVANSDLTLDAATLSPTSPVGSDIININATVSDNDTADTLTLYWIIYLDSSVNQTVNSTTVTTGTLTNVHNITSDMVTSGQNWTVEFWAGDGTTNTSHQNVSVLVGDSTVSLSTPVFIPSSPSNNSNVKGETTISDEDEGDLINVTHGMINMNLTNALYYYPLGAGFGSKVLDVANQTTANITNATWASTCTNGNCLNFDGDADYVNLDNVNDFFGSTQKNFSIEMRVNTNDVGTSQFAFFSGDKNNGFGPEFSVGLAMEDSTVGNCDNGAMCFYVYLNSSTITDEGRGDSCFVSSSTLSINTEYHVVATFEAFTECKIYLDGTLSNTDSIINDTAGWNSGSNTTYIGAAGDKTRGWDGEVQKFLLFERVLTASEVTDRYSSKGTLSGNSLSKSTGNKVSLTLGSDNHSINDTIRYTALAFDGSYSSIVTNTVSIGGGNAVPEISEDVSVSYTTTNATLIATVATDGDGDALTCVLLPTTFSKVNLNASGECGLLINESLVAGDKGTYTINISADDGTATTNSTFILTIEDDVVPNLENESVSDATPIVQTQLTISVDCADDASSIASGYPKVYVEDPDDAVGAGENLTMTISSGNTYTKLFTPIIAGVHDLKFYCEDADGNLNATEDAILTFNAQGTGSPSSNDGGGGGNSPPPPPTIIVVDPDTNKSIFEVKTGFGGSEYSLFFFKEEERKLRLVVSNLVDAPITVKVTCSADEPAGFCDNVEYSNESIFLEAQKNKNVFMTIKMPDDAEFGETFAFVTNVVNERDGKQPLLGAVRTDIEVNRFRFIFIWANKFIQAYKIGPVPLLKPLIWLLLGLGISSLMRIGLKEKENKTIIVVFSFFIVFVTASIIDDLVIGLFQSII